MIAFSTHVRRGGRMGRAIRSRAGAATSAAAMNGLRGVRLRALAVWVEGEGWVSWEEIQREVAVAFEAWRARKALQGVRFLGRAERHASGIAEAAARRKSGAEAGAFFVSKPLGNSRSGMPRERE